MKNITLRQALPWLLVIGAAIGFLASFTIMVEKLHLLSDPSYRTSCSINPVLSCGTIMKSWQAGLFGFPNPIIGLAAFPVVAAAGAALLAGATFRRWFWLSLYGGMVLGLLFVHWLFHQSLYSIGALCIYCIIVWAATIMLFWYTTLYLLRENLLPTPRRMDKTVAFMQRHHVDILLVWYVIIAGAILHRFWYYWSLFI